MIIDKDTCLMVLAKSYKDPEAFLEMETFIKKHYDLIDHLKSTRLYDVLQFEERLLQPLEILTYENEKLKKEVNKLRRELGKIEKYKEN